MTNLQILELRPINKLNEINLFSFMCMCMSFCPFSFGQCVVFPLRILITPLVSSNSPYANKRVMKIAICQLVFAKKSNKIFNHRLFLTMQPDLIFTLFCSFPVIDVTYN